VPLDEPSWWYRHDETAVATSLRPFAALYGSLTARRMAKAGTAVDAAVLCVGNLTAGGSGKTPFVRWLATEIADLTGRAILPVILSRGYGGALHGPVPVDPHKHTASAVGDEPLMLSETLPVFVARDRLAGARAIAAAGTRDQRTAIIMDDGLQNPSVRKDLRIALIDRYRGLGNGLVVPAGPLRARLATQLPHIDMVVWTGQKPAETDAAAAEPPLQLSAFPGPMIQTWTEPMPVRLDLRERPVILFTGIANPKRVAQTARNLGLTIASHRTFADHHPFTERDAIALLSEARTTDAALLTTEKDAARLKGQSGALAELLSASSVLRIQLRIAAEDRVTLRALLTETLGHR